MTLKEFVSLLIGFRIKESDTGWDEAYQQFSNTGQFTLTSSPKKYEKIILELCKRVDNLEQMPKPIPQKK